MIRKAAALPKGSVERREILSSLQRQSSYDARDHILPPGLDWNQMWSEFNTAHRLWSRGLSEYSNVMTVIEGYAVLAGPEYRKVVDLAKRGQNTARQLMKQQRSISDDLYVMLNAMPEKG
jgi:hypothetical protein